MATLRCLLRDDVDYTTHRVRPVDGALRSSDDLDSVNVFERQIGKIECAIRRCRIIQFDTV